jgi:hypothetical protein
MKTEMEKKKKEDNDVLYMLEKKKKKTNDHHTPTCTTPCKREHGCTSRETVDGQI